MWYLLLALPLIVVAMGMFARSGKVTTTDTHCTSVDLRLDRQAQLIRDGVPASVTWMPASRTASRVAPRPMANLSGELMAS